MRVAYGLLLALLFASGITAQAPPTVPRFLLDALDWPVIEFARLLASSSVPAGVELHQDDALTRPPRRMTGDTTDRIPMTDLVERFNRAQADYVAAAVDDAFVIRPEEGRVRFLNSPSYLTPGANVMGLMMAIRTILSPLDIRPRGGIVGSVMGNEAAKGRTKEFVLVGGGRSVIDTLNQLATQMPGAWTMTTRRENGEWEIVQYGFFYTDGAGTRTRMREVNRRPRPTPGGRVTVRAARYVPPSIDPSSAVRKPSLGT